MSYLTDNQKSDLKKFGKWVLIGIVVIVVIVIAVKVFLNRPTPMPAEMKAQIDSLKADNSRKDTAISMLKQIVLQHDNELSGLSKSRDVIKEDIGRNEARKVDIKQQHEKINTTVDSWSDASIDSFLSGRYKQGFLP